MSDDIRLYGLIGYPLTHSFSQRYFTAKFQRENITGCRFENFSLENIDQLKNVLQQPHLRGFAVTIPYKKKVLRFLDDAEDNVKLMQACNCVRIENGKLRGYNTDVIGFEESFKPLLQPHHTHALILGTGGAAHAVEFVLQKLGIAYSFVSRMPKAIRSTLSYDALTEKLMQQYTVIINTTPLGTYPDVDTYPPIPYHWLTEKHYLFDLVYNPEKTLFLTKGEQRNTLIKNGYDMLVIQAEENWKIWNP